MMGMDNVFLKTNDRELTYRDLWRFASSFDKLLASVDIKQHKPLGVVAEPNETTIFTIASCWILGIPVMMFPAKLTELEFNLITQNISISALIGTLNFPFPKYVKIIDNREIREKVWHSVFTDNEYTWDRSLNSDDLFGYFFTSGSTSYPKTVPIKRKNVIAAARSSLANIPMKSNELWLHILPLHHIGGISILTRALISGSGIYYIPEFSTVEASSILQNNAQVVCTSLVPTQLRRLLELKDFETHKSFKAILLGGGPISEELIKKSRQRNIPVITSFGMTETTAQCIAMPFSERFTGPANSCGKPLEGIEMKLIVDNDNASSIICLRGDQIFEGYLEASLNTDAFDSEGWFSTGDYATVDDQGYVQIIMRRSDRIVSGGENINPVEIESLLHQFSGISDVAIVGLPNQEWGQVVTAVIVLSDEGQHVSLNEVKTFLNQKISSFKIPKQLIAVAEIPRTSSGKIKRIELLKMLTG
jgi:O-succinylbenzoic acid--CoA ligase